MVRFIRSIYCYSYTAELPLNDGVKKDYKSFKKWLSCDQAKADTKSRLI